RRRAPVTRSYQSECDYLWQAWYITGDRRALDLIDILWNQEIKTHENLPFRGTVYGSEGWSRHRNVLMRAGIEMYEATFDPWYLVFGHVMAELESAQILSPDSGYHGNDYEPGLREFLRFTGDPDFRDRVYLPYVQQFGDADYPGWGGKDQIEPLSYGW